MGKVVIFSFPYKESQKSYSLLLSRADLKFVKKTYTTQFAGKRILHTENAEIMAIFARNKIT